MTNCKINFARLTSAIVYRLILTAPSKKTRTGESAERRVQLRALYQIL